MEASAAQNAPVNIICSQCGAVLPETSGHCRYCDTSFSEELLPRGQSADEGSTAAPARRAPMDPSVDPAWRSELAGRLAAYRTRRRKPAPHDAQSALPFEAGASAGLSEAAVALAEPPRMPPAASSGLPQEKEEFAFTIAIGRSAKPALDDPDAPGPAHMEIDVSLPPASIAPEAGALSKHSAIEAQLYPVASLADRVFAALLDAACLLSAYGGFLLFFTTFGGEFTPSKLTAAVCITTLAIFYLQYFALFTVFGGTTPGMMFRGLRVTTFSGEAPAPRQLVLRSLGYLLSAGSFLLGFLWAFWDEDSLTWHDRLSHTYLTAAESVLDGEVQDALESSSPR